MESAGNTVHGCDQVLVDADWLEAHLHDPLVRVVEIDVSPAAYDAGHIEGTVLWNVYTDLKDADYRLVDTEAIEDLLSRSGIAEDSTVVLYGYAPAMGFWLLRLYGHRDVRLLDCARGTWQAEGRAWTTEPPRPDSTRYRLPDPDGRIRATWPEVLSAVEDPRGGLLDVRTEAEFRGERFWPSGGMEPGGRAGHVPSATNLPIDGLYDDRGAYRAEGDLREVFNAVDVTSDADLITYCTIGGRACTAWFVLTYLLGRGNVRVYDGSWAEWGRMPAAPVVGEPTSLTESVLG